MLKNFKILAISGSTRKASTNTALLQFMAKNAPEGFEVTMLEGLSQFPIFSSDHEENPPQIIIDYKTSIAAADALVIASPEYVRAIPGGLKNAIDWLVSGDIITHKPIALAHASHRGEDMLSSLRMVLATVSTALYEDVFLRVPLVGKTAEEVEAILSSGDHLQMITAFLNDFRDRLQIVHE